MWALNAPRYVRSICSPHQAERPNRGWKPGRPLVLLGREGACLPFFEAPEHGLRPLPCPCPLPQAFHVLPTLSQGYSIASGHPVVRQEGNKDPKANDSEEEVQQPSHNLERVRGPAPPVPARPLALQLGGHSAGLGRRCPHTLLRGCLVGGLVADVHLQRKKK